tara:strand:+ start:184 stop:1119 length:936 start_codon:yes stop_codon:yes gene_type:complete
MSEIETSPAPAAEAPAEASTGAVESAEPSGEVTETTIAEPVQEVSTEPEGSAIEEPEAPAFDPESWDGNMDALPAHLQEPVRFLHRQLEGGYTKKFQSLSDERKAFESDRDSWKESNTGWKDEKDRLESELNLLRNLMNGEEDPRLEEYQEKNSGLIKNLAELQHEYEVFKGLVEEDIEEQSRLYAERFRSDNAEIFESEDKRQSLSTLLNQGWTPEVGVKLIGQNEKVIELANELREQGSPPAIAVEHALLKLGNEPTRSPRPGARLTSGAEGRNNPNSVKQSVSDANNSNEARLLAARAAMNWKSKGQA